MSDSTTEFAPERLEPETVPLSANECGPELVAQNGRVSEPIQEASTYPAGNNGIVEFEAVEGVAEQQIPVLVRELSCHDSRIAALEVAVTSNIRSADLLEKALAEARGEVVAYRRRLIESQSAQVAGAAAAPERRWAIIEQAHRAEVERLSRALQRSQLEVASLRSRELIAQREREVAQRAYEAIVNSASWRATRPIRVVAKALLPRLRQSIRYGGKLAFWLVTPFSIPRRLRNYQAELTAARRFAADYDLVATSNLFDAEWYLTKHPDVAAGGQDPLSHYFLHGAAEGRNPGPSFDTSAYIATNADVAASGVNPLVHYLRHGFLEQRSSTPAQGR